LSRPRVEDGRLLRGQGRFIDNLRLPGMLHMVLVRSPHASAAIQGVDVDAARRLDGVAGAWSGADLAGELPAMPVFLFPGSNPPEHRPMAVDQVLSVGEPVAVVVASDPARAVDAADRVDVRYETRPAVVDAEAALQAGSPLVHPGTWSNLAYGFELGEPPGLAGSDVIVEERLVNQRVAPAPMETRGLVADYRAGDGSLTLYLATQGPHLVRAEVAGCSACPRRWSGSSPATWAARSARSTRCTRRTSSRPCCRGGSGAR
jgi:carbon-monoxide dehydrogenase large subunit